MNYQYFYQTRDNQNREGWIKARDRADAYTRLRKQGIKPYRVVGDDPVRWQPWAIGGAFAVLVLALVAALVFGRGDDDSPLSRRQLVGDRSVVSAGLASSWDGVFTTKLDRYLAAYAQPGWIAVPPECSDAEIAAFVDELETPLVLRDGDGVEIRLLKRIVATLRAEMRDYLAAGGSVADYLAFLEDRQDQERDLRGKAIDSVARAPESMRERARFNMNVRLREMGIAEIQ